MLGGVGLGFANPFPDSGHLTPAETQASAALDDGAVVPTAKASSLVVNPISSPGPEVGGPLGDYAPVVHRIPTTDKVVFVGIDDGWIRDPGLRDIIVTRHLPVTLFLTTQAVAADLAYFHDLVNAGAVVEDHTLTHPMMPTLNAAGQRLQICGAADALATEFGRRPTLFRAPYNEHDATTQLMATACGMRALIQWDAAVNDGVVTYASGHGFKAGDIVLMHFRKTGALDMNALLKAVANAGLTIGRLESYVGTISPLTGRPPLDPQGIHRRPSQSPTPVPGDIPGSHPSPSEGPSRPGGPPPTHVASSNASSIPAPSPT